MHEKKPPQDETPSTKGIERASTDPAEKEHQRSVQDYLDSLVWDGTPRLDRWLVDCAGAEDTARVRATSRAMLVAAVRRARQPGCSYDQMPVIEGPQGSGKSSALRLLAVEEAWFSDAFSYVSVADRRVAEVTEGKWIVELGELDNFLRGPAAQGDADDEDGELLPPAALKTYLSRTHDEACATHTRGTSLVPRSHVVVGTTNSANYLQDTGNRRYWTVDVRRFDLDRLAEARDQLWAEAAVAESRGEPIQLEVS